MPKYKIKNTNILHNGELKKIGDVIELTDKEAGKLADILTPVKETKTQVKTPDKNTTAVNNNQPENKENSEQQKDGGNK